MKAVETKALSKHYGDLKAVDSLDLEVEKGELYALLGVNGAGKTTTIKMLSCLTRPGGGDARILGDSVIGDPYAVKQKINVSPQETAVAPNLTVRENLEMMAGIYGLPREQVREKAQGIIETFGLSETADKKAKNLSGGMQRRLSIGMALITGPEVLFLDEPTLGLDVLARRELWGIIEKLKQRITIILTTHYLEEVEALSDHVGVMSKGRLVASGTVAQLKERTGTDSLENAFVKLAMQEVRI